jgi:hypothetical protein
MKIVKCLSGFLIMDQAILNNNQLGKKLEREMQFFLWDNILYDDELGSILQSLKSKKNVLLLMFVMLEILLIKPFSIFLPYHHFGPKFQKKEE